MMKTRLLLTGSLVACLVTVSVPAFAHHAWHGYDMANLTTVKGSVTQFDWSNPHVWISLEAKDDKANIEKWSAGGPSPSRMANTGWDKDTLKGKAPRHLHGCDPHSAIWPRLRRYRQVA